MYGVQCAFCGGMLEAYEEHEGQGTVLMYRCPFCMREERYIVATERFSMF